jgi:hypothetical protein
MDMAMSTLIVVVRMRRGAIFDVAVTGDRSRHVLTQSDRFQLQGLTFKVSVSGFKVLKF